MSKDITVNNFIKFLKHEECSSFLSDNFIAFRCSDMNIIKNKEDALNYFKGFKNVDDISYKNEDSHYLVYYQIDDVKYILKLKFDSDYLIESMVEEIYDESNIQVVLVIEYDGKQYYGMQKQDGTNFKSIQEEIEKSIKKMISKEVNIIFSSRTDKGVHAKGQVIQFKSYGIDPKSYKYALNNLLPGDIRIIDAYKRSQLFNCRYDTVKKEYQYVVDTGEYSVFDKDYVWYTKIKNIELIKKEMKSLLGTHDFKAFSKGEKDNTTRTIYEASIIEKGTRLYFKFVGSGFLHNMIRFIMGSLVNIDKEKNKSIKELIELKDKNETALLAPSSGLYLIKIEY